LLKSRDKNDLGMKANAYLKLGDSETAFQIFSDQYQFPPPELHKEFASQDILDSDDYNNINPLFLTDKNWEPRETILFSGDLNYIGLFFEKSVYGVKATSEKLNIHLHAMLTSDKELNLVEKYVDKKTSVSCELYKPQTTAGFTTRRFVQLRNLLKNLNAPVLSLDIDCEISSNIEWLFQDLSRADIALFRRKFEPVINQAVSAAIFFAAPTSGADRFLLFLSRYFSYLERNSRLIWFSDQLALCAADQFFSSSSSDIKISEIPTSVLSFTRYTPAPIYAMKGKDKF